ncbi:hypothetical protein [Desulfomonile tiedjei]|uniref:Uncharacterized protein n=1 Tax=Desulfomonile tiedjei (strain ATCC 49306 / DSM 6799 / DCB-1) TaxID=706587 RepID=I4C2T3_DESTA|nr:hypothetical protein [Desulfomonile tiedjei]AFM23874.1 hypothetical protein Desti_1161 [Desulfomonile tiedjei DSM 6799]
MGLIDQFMELNGRVLNNVFDWPFLAFVFLVWLANRYRDQIGSMLDRRNTIPSGELAKNVKVQLEPLVRDVAQLGSEVSELKSKMVESLHPGTADDMLNPINARISVVEDTLGSIRTKIEGFNHKDLPELVTRGLEPLSRELDKMKDDLQQMRSDTESYVSQEMVADFKGALDLLSSDLAALKLSLSELGAITTSFASKTDVKEIQTASVAAVEQVKSSVSGMQAQLSDLGAGLTKLEKQLSAGASKDALTELQSELKLLSSGVSTMRETLASMQPTFVSRDSFDELQSVMTGMQTRVDQVTANLLQIETTALDDVRTQVNNLEKSISGLRDFVNSSPAELMARWNEDIQPLSRDLGMLKVTVEQLAEANARSQEPVVVESNKTRESGKKKGKSKRPELHR